MTRVAGESHPSCVRAARALWIWIASVALFVLVAVLLAPEEKRTLPNAVPTVLLNAVLLLFAHRISLGVLRGQRLVAATVLLAIYGALGFVVAMVLVALRTDYEGFTPLIVAKFLVLLAWAHALVSVMRAKRSAHRRVSLENPPSA